MPDRRFSQLPPVSQFPPVTLVRGEQIPVCGPLLAAARKRHGADAVRKGIDASVDRLIGGRPQC